MTLSNHRRSTASTTLAALTLVLAACGSDSSTASTTDAGSVAVVTAPASDSTVAAPASDSTVAAPEAESTQPTPVDTTEVTTRGSSGSVDPSKFFDGALIGDAVTVDCTLAGGTETSCYEITIAGFPTTRTEIGPFCPSTTSDGADTGGIWFDGDALYDIDGAFIVGLAELYDDPSWKLYDDDGNVRTTDTAELFEAAIQGAFGNGEVDPNNQNLCIQGSIEWLDNGEPIPVTVEVPVTPVLAAEPTDVGMTLGVTLDGVRIENSAPVDAILGAYTIAAFDDCGGHINPDDGYHMHATLGCSATDGEVSDSETSMFAYALDGFAIHEPLDESVEAAAGLDECNGHTTDDLGYHYHANHPEENAVLTCFSGETTEAATAGQGGGPGGGGGAPDFTDAAAALGVTVDELTAALGQPPFDLDEAAATLGVTVTDLEAALPAPPNG
jgi:YHYH protein